MRGSSRAEELIDPVEQERKLLGLSDGTPVRSARPPGEWTFLSKLAVALAITLVLAYLVMWVAAVQSNGGPEGYVRVTDFISTLTGGQIIRNGDAQALYDPNVQRAAQLEVLSPYRTLLPGQILPYNHLPFEALFVAPFMALPLPLVFATWTLLMGVVIGLSLGALDGALSVSRRVGWVMSMAACSYMPLIRSLMLGQNSALVLLGLCGTYVALKRDKPNWASASLLLVALKPQVLPAVLLLLILQKEWRTILGFVGLLSALSVAAMSLLGVGWPVQYARLLLNVGGWSDKNAIDPGIMHNWRGFATDLLGAFPSLQTPLYIALSLLSLGVIAWAWSHSWRGTQPIAGTKSRDWSLLWALTAIVAILTSLHLNPHDLTLAIFPAWIIAMHAMSPSTSITRRLMWLSLLWTAYAFFPLGLALQGSTGNSGLLVIPSVLLMACTALLLALEIARINRPAAAHA
ncbi:MAG: DUF2029 domain-containing protein [Chloroflexota bacterium]|nr:DUF2029 domain-containing protein [Chloroflexota bacterium]